MAMFMLDPSMPSLCSRSRFHIVDGNGPFVVSSASSKYVQSEEKALLAPYDKLQKIDHLTKLWTHWDLEALLIQNFKK